VSKHEREWWGVCGVVWCTYRGLFVELGVLRPLLKVPLGGLGLKRLSGRRQVIPEFENNNYINTNNKQQEID
jgi:hypothetical protein